MEPSTLFAAVKIARWWKRVRPIRTFKENRMLLKGKLTYTAAGAFVASLLARVLGIEVADAEVQAIVQNVIEAVAAVAVIYGRYRATKQ